jgi:hypothetical protein
MNDHWERWAGIATTGVVIGFFLWIMVGSEVLLSNIGALVFLALTMIGAVGCLGLLRFSATAGKTHFDYMQIIMTILMTVATASSAYVSYRAMQDTNDRRTEDQRPIIRFKWDRPKLAIEMVNVGKGDAIIGGVDFMVDDDFLTVSRFPYSEEDVKIIGPVTTKFIRRVLRFEELEAVKGSFPNIGATIDEDSPKPYEIVSAGSRRVVSNWVVRDKSEVSLADLAYSDWGRLFGLVNKADMHVCYCAVLGQQCFTSSLGSSAIWPVNHCMPVAQEGRVIVGQSNPEPVH